MVRTTNSSIEEISPGWNVFQLCDRGFRVPIMYLPTVDSGDLYPEHQQFAVDPRCSHCLFSLLIRRISARGSQSLLGLPPRRQDFQRQ
jgi:hypothetical protein